jgi:hypothetical protein
MTLPSVCGIMLTNGRPEMAARAARCFRAQSYTGRRWLLIWDTGPRDRSLGDVEEKDGLMVLHSFQPNTGKTIGALRNDANAATVKLGADILIHFDSDDWSAPGRIAEQVRHLQASGAPAVGYNEMLFYKTIEREAWRYRSAIPFIPLGTSLCYWAETWLRKPFKAVNNGEDTRWLTGLRAKGISASSGVRSEMMIATMHGGNTVLRIPPHTIGKEWNRAEMWDKWCEERINGMVLA